jgi:hypothetical protein
VDVNNASVTALLKLPGVDGDIATEICECREKLGGFATLEDLGATLDLDGGVVEGLRAKVVFLPRGSRPVTSARPPGPSRCRWRTPARRRRGW